MFLRIREWDSFSSSSGDKPTPTELLPFVILLLYHKGYFGNPNMSTETDEYSSSRMNSLDILAAIFFVIAGAWLIIALVYSFLVVVFLRLRARGELGSIYEEDFGRIYLCGSNRYYISFGGLFRRYVRHVQPEPSPGETVIQTVKFMTRAERREAMEILLQDSVNKGRASIKSKEKGRKFSPDDTDIEGGQEASVLDDKDSHCDLDTGSSQEPVCSICLGEYEPYQHILRSKTCPHEFHRECIMDWLQRQINTECPCCRSTMVDEKSVWATVKQQRKLKKRVSRHKTQTKVLRKNENSLVLSQMTGDGYARNNNDSNHLSEATTTSSPPSLGIEIDSGAADRQEAEI